MNYEAFEKEMGRIKNTFGKNSYSREREKLIWFSVSKYTNADFKSAVDRLIAQERYAPLPDKFKEALRNCNTRSLDGSKTPDGCDYCVGYGCVLVKHISKPGVNFAMKCSCPAGKGFAQKTDTPYWSSEQRNKGWSRIKPNIEWPDPG